MRSSLARWFSFALLGVMACTPAQPPTTAPTGGAVAPTQQAEQRAEQQSLKIAVRGLIGNMTPQASRTNLYQYWPMYDSLTQFGPDYAVKPSVAEKWEVSADGLTWTFKIRGDMKFANGDPLTADDVVFTLQEVFDKKWPQSSYFEGMTEAKAADPTTVQILLKTKNAAIPYGGPFLWILPKKYYGQIGSDAFVQKPMGSGPYELVEFKNADRITFKKRAEKHAFRSPIATDLEIRLIPDNAQIINGLTTGDIDIAPLVGWSGDQVETLKQRGIVNVGKLATNSQVALPQGSYELRDTPLKDKRVRIALNYAVNKDGLSNGLYRGTAQSSGQLAVPGSLYHDPSVKPYPYDPAMAKKLLTEAGYPNGFKLTGGYDFSSGRGENDMIISIQADLKAVGVEVELIPNEESIFVDKAYGRRDLPKGDMWAGGNNDDNGFFTGVRTFYGCGKPVGGPARSTLYCNPEWDRLMNEAYAEPDAQKRVQIFRQANKVFRDDVPNIFLIDRSFFMTYTSKIKGIEVPTPSAFNFDSAYKVK